MMLPGAVSLGAYEGGALAAILKAVQISAGDLVVDAIASASAGSMTALIACRALLCDADPVDLMTKTWVDLPQLDRLETHDLTSPLTMNNLMATADQLLGTELVPDGQNPPQEGSVRLSMALTALGGLTYAMPRLQDSHDPSYGKPMLATTYVDFFTTELTAPADSDAFKDVLDAAMSSGSTPVGFPARQMIRDDSTGTYQSNGVLTPQGRPFTLWYSDGGDVDNQPFGRLLDLIEQVPENDDERVIVMLNIEPAAEPTWEGTWFDEDPEHVPLWLSTLFHVDHIRASQTLYDDLRRLEKINSHIRWLKQVAGTLQQSLDSTALAQGVGEAAEQLSEKRKNIADQIRNRVGGDAPATGTPPAEGLEDLLLEAAGLSGKKAVVVEIISPDSDPSVHLTAEQQLSGEFLFHFGGFFDRRFRESDFALGYRNAYFWLDWWLDGRVSDRPGILAEVKEAYERLPWCNEMEGDASVKTLSIKEKVEGIDLLGHIEHVVQHDVVVDVGHELDHRKFARTILDELEHDLHLKRNP